jgi:hypothetical protein
MFDNVQLIVTWLFQIVNHVNIFGIASFQSSIISHQFNVNSFGIIVFDHSNIRLCPTVYHDRELNQT